MSEVSRLSPVQPGETLAGRYRVERVLGVGGMGVVVAARHLQLDSRVAVKFLHPDVLENTEAVDRFAREARAAVKIQNDHVARVTDVGTLEDGAPFMVMEYLEGSDLGELLRSNGCLSIDDAVDFVLQASEAIAEAHSLGIVHRDLKPANLFLVRRSDGSRTIKVLDFGISKTSGMIGSSGSAGITRTATLMGSPLYMSPEQLQSARDVDVRADIWSLGIILHELLTGKAPFSGETIPQLCVAILNEPALPLRSYRADVPESLEHVVLCCLEKDRSRRFPHVGAFASALSEVAPPRSAVSVERIMHLLGANPVGGYPLAPPRPSSPRLHEGAASGPGMGTGSAWGRTDVAARRASRRNVLKVAGPIAVLGAIAAGFVVARPTSPEKTMGAAASQNAEPAPAAEPIAPKRATPLNDVAPNGPAEPASPTPEPPRTEPVASAPTRLPVASARPPTRSAPGTASPRAVAPPPPRKTRAQPASGWEDDRK